jgi:hypothetical protein
MAKSDALFVTEAQCAERLGLTTEQFKIVLPAATKSGLPHPDPLFANRRYWPAVKAWLDHRYGMGPEGSPPPGLDGKENWK